MGGSASPRAVGATNATHQMNLDGHLILGDRSEPGEGERFTSHNPSTGAALLELREASDRQIDSAIAAARSAFETW